LTSKLDSLVSQTGPSGFCGFRVEEGFKDHRARDGSSTSLVSSKPHTQLEEEDPSDEGAKDEGRGGREGKRRVLQHQLASIPTKQEWRVKEKVDTPAPMTFDNNRDLLNDNEALLIKDGSPPPTGMDINMVFMLLTEFRDMEEEVTQMCLGPKEVMFEKPEESSRHLKPLYIRGHIDGKPVNRMLIDGGAAVNLMSYTIFKKLRREDNELMKTNLMLNGVGATRWRLGVSFPWSPP
jgi:hypothetical protein